MFREEEIGLCPPTRKVAEDQVQWRSAVGRQRSDSSSHLQTALWEQAAELKETEQSGEEDWLAIQPAVKEIAARLIGLHAKDQIGRHATRNWSRKQALVRQNDEGW